MAFVGAAVEGVKNFTIDKSCVTCDVYRDQVLYLRLQLEKEQQRNKEIEMRLTFNEPQNQYVGPTREQMENLRVQGVTSPMKQRAVAERKSKVDWSKRVKDLPDLPLAVTTATMD